MQPTAYSTPQSVERERHRAGGVAEVPDHGNAACVAVRGDRRHVMGRTRSKIDVGEQDQRGVTVDRADNGLGLRQGQIEPLAGQLDEPLQDVDIGWEVAALGDDGTSALALAQQRGRELEQVDGGGVRADDLAFGGTDQRRDSVADLACEKEPVGIEPTLDQAPAPLFLHDAADIRRGGLRQCAEGVAVEVEHPLRQRKPLAAVGERARPVQPLTRRAVYGTGAAPLGNLCIRPPRWRPVRI